MSIQSSSHIPLSDLVATAIRAAAGNENTEKAYKTAIGMFLEFLDNRIGEGFPPAWRPLAEHVREGRLLVWKYHGESSILREVDLALLDDFTAWRAVAGDSKRSSVLRRRAVTTMLRVAYREGILTDGQAQSLGIKAFRKLDPGDSEPVRRILSPEEVNALRAAVQNARTDGKALRDRAILDLLLFAGLRYLDVANLRIEYLRQEGENWWITLMGKSGKTRRVKVHPVLQKSLADWLASQNKAIGGEDTGPVFFNLTNSGSSTGIPLNPAVTSLIVAEYGAAAGLAPRHGKDQLCPQDLRRTCACNAFDNGANLLLVQEMLGHLDPKTTARFIGAAPSSDENAIDYVRY